MIRVRDALVELVDTFEPGPEKDHFGLITFNSKATTEFTFADKALHNKQNLENRIRDMSLTLRYQTRTDLAMMAARDDLFSLSGGDRPDRPNLMILLTDGKPSRQPKPFEEFAAEFHKDPKVLCNYTFFEGFTEKTSRYFTSYVAFF